MKIGLIASGYNCEQFLAECVAGWKQFKAHGEHELVCSFVHNCFKENQELGFSRWSSDNTMEMFDSYFSEGFLDYYDVSKKYLNEHEARNICLKNVLSSDVDYVWTIGLDEIYSFEDISKILKFVQMNSFITWFKVNYKNYVFDGKQWIDGFCPPRVFKVAAHGGLKKLYYDDDFVYNDGTDYKAAPCLEVPRNIAHIKHMTWLHSNGKAKVEYQKKRWGDDGCSYSWNYDENKLIFNTDFHKKNNIPLPALIKE